MALYAITVVINIAISVVAVPRGRLWRAAQLSSAVELRSNSVGPRSTNLLRPTGTGAEIAIWIAAPMTIGIIVEATIRETFTDVASTHHAIETSRGVEATFR